jgi:hypothetical protein
MPALSSKTSANSVLTAIALYFGVCLYLLSFALPAVGNLTGLECAEFAIESWRQDDKISSLALFGGWLNPQVLLLFLLSVFHVAPRLRAVLSVSILFSIAMTWIAIHRMNAAGMFMDLKVGHFLWITGILLIVVPNLPTTFSFRFARRLAVAGAAVIAFLSVPLLIALTMHAASEKDDFLYVAAWTLKESALCGKIDARAIGRPDQRDSTDLTYMQSDCYRNVAAMLRAPQLCHNVKSAGVDRLIGSPVAKFKCRKQNYTQGTAMQGSDFNFVRAMQFFGFTDEYLTQIHYEGRPDIYLLPILNELQADSTFLSRLQASPSYAEPSAPEHQRDAHPLEFLDEMAAVQWDLPALCQKISSNSRERTISPYTPPLRGVCYANIAFNRRDNALCRELPHAKNFQQTNQSAFLEGCMKNVAVLRNPNSNVQWVHYGPGVFPTWPQFQQAIKELGYPPTTSWLHLPQPTSQEYENYLWELAVPEHQLAREDFVRRVLATP